MQTLLKPNAGCGNKLMEIKDGKSLCKDENYGTIYPYVIANQYDLGSIPIYPLPLPLHFACPDSC